MKWNKPEANQMSVGHDKAANHFAYYDCSLQTPKGRKGACYDREGLEGFAER